MWPHALVCYQGTDSGWVSLAIVSVVVIAVGLLLYFGYTFDKLKSIVKTISTISDYAWLVEQQLTNFGKIVSPIPTELSYMSECDKYSNIAYKKITRFLDCVNVGRLYDEEGRASLAKSSRELYKICNAVVYKYPCNLRQAIVQGLTMFHGKSRKYVPTQIDLNDARVRVLKKYDGKREVVRISNEYIGLFNNDTPILSKDSDKLNRTNYAKNIAQMLRLLPSNASFTVGLYGKWGYGKTSTIKLIQESLKDDHNVICLNTSPWSYKTREEFASDMLCAIQNAVGGEALGLSGIPGKLTRVVRRHLKYITGSDGQISLMVASKLNWTISRKLGLQDIVTRIEKNVAKSTKKIIIFIDDIDRLTPDQVINTLTLVHSVAHIKGAIYFLSLDRQATATLIERGLGSGVGDADKEASYGLSYLNKIVQIPLDLAYIPDQSLDEQLWRKLKDVITYHAGKAMVTRNDIDRVRSVYSLLKDKVKTPRDVVLCCNAVGSALMVINDDVNIGDLICIELIRVLDRGLYFKLRENYSRLTNRRLRGGSGSNSRECVGHLFDDNESHRQIVEYLFPGLRMITLTNDDYNRHHGICLDEYVERYFVYSLQLGELSDSEIVDILRRDDAEADDVRLLFKDSKFDRKMLNLSSEIADERRFLPLLIETAEMDSKSRLASGMFETSLFQKSVDVVGAVIRQETKAESRAGIYREVIKKVTNTDALALVLQMIQRDDNIEQVKDKCKDAVLEKIEGFINDKRLPTRGCSYLSADLYEYFIMFGGNKNYINGYIESQVETADDAVDFISQFLVSSFSISSGVEYKHDLFERDVYKRLDTIADPDRLYNIIVSDDKYSHYVNLARSNVKRFNRSDLSRAENMLEQEFRDVVAQQFIYLHDAGK